MDIIAAVSTMAAVYGYYKVGIYVADTVDKGVKVYTLCKNSIGYVRRPIRYYFDTDNESQDSYPDIPPRPSSCSVLEGLKKRDLYNDNDNDDECDNNDDYDNYYGSDSGIKEHPMSKTVSDINELKVEIKKKNRETSISTCSEATEMFQDEFLIDVSWIMVKNPDYGDDEF
jgi:hypothetical protein